METAPDDIIIVIIKHLSVKVFGTVTAVSKRFNKFIKNDLIWEMLWCRDYGCKTTLLVHGFAIRDYHILCPDYKRKYQKTKNYVAVKIFDDHNIIIESVLFIKFCVAYLQNYLCQNYIDKPYIKYMKTGLIEDIRNKYGVYILLQEKFAVRFLGADEITLISMDNDENKSMKELYKMADDLLLRCTISERLDKSIESVREQIQQFEAILSDLQF